MKDRFDVEFISENLHLMPFRVGIEDCIDVDFYKSSFKYCSLDLHVMYLHNQIHYFITALAMNCIFKDGRDLVQMLERTLPFLHEANLEFTEDGLIMHSIDSTHIVLVDNCLRLSCFESYTIDKGKFGLDIYNVWRI